MKKYIYILIYFIPFFVYGQVQPSDTIPDNTGLSFNEKEETGYLRTKALPSGYTNNDVGEIPISWSNSNGGLTCTIPIDYIADKQSGISLVYNSLSGNGMAGMGWNIAGIESISITHSNYYYDGSGAKSEKKDAISALSLNGIRLKPDPASSTTNPKIYKTVQSNIKVLSYFESGKYYLEAQYPDGSRGTFGYKDSNTAQINYPLTKKEDNLGNSIEYVYIKSNNTYYISEILFKKYTQLVSSVKFEYINRTDINTIYRDGETIIQDRLLSKIKSYYQTTLLRTYTLTYKSETVNLLSKIECESEGKKLNPLVFSYGTGDKVEQVYSYNKSIIRRLVDKDGSPVNKVVYKFGHFKKQYPANGMIMLPDHGVYEKTGTYKVNGEDAGYTYGSNWSPSQQLYVFKDINNMAGDPSLIIPAEKGFNNIFAADIDGNGVDEIVKVNYWVNSENNNTIHLQYWEDNQAVKGKAFTVYDTYRCGVSETPLSPIYRQFVYGDFNGDGKIELLAVSARDTYGGDDRNLSWITMFDIKNLNVLYNRVNYPNQGICMNMEDVLLPIDIDGDGKTDLVHVNLYGTWIFEFIDNGFKLMEYYPQLTRTDIKMRGLLLGDINGDGKTDIILPSKLNDYSERITPCGSCSACINEPGMVGEDPGLCQNPIRTRIQNPTAYDWRIYYSTGKGFDLKTFKIATNEKDRKFTIHDVNMDGIGDLVQAEPGGSLTVYLNEHGKFRTNGISTRFNGDKYSNFLVAEYDNYRSYSNSNNLLYTSGSNVYSVDYSTNTGIERMLSSTTDSKGLVTNYNYSTSSIINYTSLSNNLSYPDCNFIGKINALNSVSTYMDNKQVNNMGYTYTDPVINRIGLGFKGFFKIESRDYIRNTVFTQIYDPSKFSTPKSSDSPFSAESFDYNIVTDDNKFTKIELKKRVVTDKLKGTTQTYTYIYDTYGNPTKETIDYGGGIKRVTDNVYNNHTSTFYKLGELSQQTISDTRGSSVASKILLSYTNDNKRLPTSKKSYYNNNLVSEEAYSYNSNGYLTESKSKSYSSSNWLSVKYDYDSYGRTKSQTDPMGFNVYYEYNNKGLLSLTKNHKQQATKYEYDTWGRKTKTSYPDGVIETLSLNWTTSPTGALYMISQTTTGQPATQVYYDALGREIRSGQMRFNSQYLYTDNVYDDKGRLEKTSLPFKGSKPGKWNTYEYDTYDRIIKLQYASGKTDTYSYNGNSVTQNIDGIATTKTYDTSGELISIQDPAGTITYNLRPDRQPASVIAPGGITTTFEYDNYGRQTAINDPSAGRRIFTYDTNGNINKETDARNNVTTKVYDRHNRIKEMTVAGIKTTYVYNSPDSLLSSVTSNNGISKTIAYDSLGRVNTEKYTIVDGKYLQKKYTYSNSNVSSIAFTSQSGSLGTEHYTYTNGHHSETKLNTTSVWKLTAENDMGIASQAATGSLTRTYTYDAYGMPTGRTTKKGTTVIQDFSYNFNPQTGNLNWRKDNTRSLQENFGYDNLNRLTSFGGKTIAYDIKGNVTDHSEIGKFSYNQTKPYAIEAITPYGNSIPLRSQNIAYNALQRPTSIKENGYEALLTYNADGDRVKMVMKKNNIVQYTRYYLGNEYEIEIAANGAVTERKYIDGDAYDAASVYIKQNNAWSVHYICRDYLGNITHVTDANGTLKQELSYDPWGRLRNPANHQLYTTDSQPVLLLVRGFTGHEHLIEFGLINMNARLYDPVLGRFLSPDPYVQDPFFSQNYNRYSYAWNNPLRFTDPNGEWVHIVVGAVIGGVVNWVAHGCKFDMNGLAAFGIGAAAGAIGAATFGVGLGAMGVAGAGLTSMGAIGGGGIIAGAAAGAFSYTMSAPVLFGGNHLAFGDPLPTTGEFFAGMGLAALGGGITQGLAARSQGYNPINGGPTQNSLINEAQISAMQEINRAPVPAASNMDDVLMERLGNKTVNSYLSMKTNGTYLNSTTQINELSSKSLNPTHYITKSRTEMQNLLNNIRDNGIKNPIKFVEHNNVKYIVDGHHRFYSAQKLGIQNIPTQQVQLPYGGYKNIMDLMLEPGKQPGYWKYMK